MFDLVKGSLSLAMFFGNSQPWLWWVTTRVNHFAIPPRPKYIKGLNQHGQASAQGACGFNGPVLEWKNESTTQIQPLTWFPGIGLERSGFGVARLKPPKRAPKPLAHLLRSPK